MNDEEIRAIVRRVVAERLAGGGAPPASTSAGAHAHASHGRLRMAPSVEKGQPCLIEPDVPCALCGFCQSLGH
jgi:hypothetical protein